MPIKKRARGLNSRHLTRKQIFLRKAVLLSSVSFGFGLLLPLVLGNVRAENQGYPRIVGKNQPIVKRKTQEEATEQTNGDNKGQQAVGVSKSLPTLKVTSLGKVGDSKGAIQKAKKEKEETEKANQAAKKAEEAAKRVESALARIEAAAAKAERDKNEAKKLDNERAKLESERAKAMKDETAKLAAAAKQLEAALAKAEEARVKAEQKEKEEAAKREEIEKIAKDKEAADKAEAERIVKEIEAAEKAEKERMGDKAGPADPNAPSISADLTAPSQNPTGEKEGERPTIGLVDMSTFDDLKFLMGETFGKNPKAKKDSIALAMTSAYDTNPDLRQQRATVRATDETIVQAKAGWRPQITGTLSAGIAKTRITGDTINKTIQDDVSPTLSSKTDDQQQAGVEARYNLFEGWKTVYATKEAKANIKLERARLAEVEQTVLLNAVQVYVDLLTKYKEVEVLKRTEDRLKKTLEVNEAKFAVGAADRTDVAQAKGNYADTVARRLNAEAELETLHGSYERVMGRPAGTLSKPVLPDSIPASIEIVLERARLNNPSIKTAEFDEKVARHTVYRTQGDLFPSLDVVGQSQASLSRHRDRGVGNLTGQNNLFNTWLNDRNLNHSVKVQLTIPIYERGTVRSKTRQAAEQAQQKLNALETARRKVMEAAVKAWSDFTQTKEGLVYYKQEVEARIASLDGVQQQYLIGNKILLDVLNEMEKLTNAQLTLAQAEKVYYLAAYQLLSAMGELTAKSMKLKVDLYDSKLHYQQVKNKF